MDGCPDTNRSRQNRALSHRAPEFPARQEADRSHATDGCPDTNRSPQSRALRHRALEFPGSKPPSGG